MTDIPLTYHYYLLLREVIQYSQSSPPHRAWLPSEPVILEFEQAVEVWIQDMIDLKQ